MSEEKLHVIKSRSGDKFYFSGDRMIPNWSDNLVRLFGSYEVAKEIAEDNNGQPVTFVEEPEKVALTKEQSKIVEEAKMNRFPASHISACASPSDDEKLLINAYVNGYTVAKEKRYLVGLDGLVTTDGAQQYLTKKDGKWFASRKMPGMHQDFTDEELNNAPEWAQQLDREEVAEAEIEHYGLQDCKKEEVTDDEQ